MTRMIRIVLCCGVFICTLFAMMSRSGLQAKSSQDVGNRSYSKSFSTIVQPLLKKYCLECHSTQAKKGSLDLERFTTLDLVRKEIKPWQNMIEQIETGEMPPKKKAQPSNDEKQRLLTWLREFLDHEARSKSGDPGHVPLRRLSHTEYDNTIRDLTGIDLRPTREFPPDGAGGEGFTNAAESLTDISPALLTKYLNAAKDTAEHVVLLPDGFRFSPSKTRRDWTDASTRELQRFYEEVAGPDGKLVVQPYLAATVKYRDALFAKTKTLQEVARLEKLNSIYLEKLWLALNSHSNSFPLNDIAARWRHSQLGDVPGLVKDITVWQESLWKAVKIGNYIQAKGSGYAECYNRQTPSDPGAVETLPLAINLKPTPGQNDVILYLAARDLFPTQNKAQVIWQRPRFEAEGKPALLLKDYSQYGHGYEVDYQAIFADTARYLQAVAESKQNSSISTESLAGKHDLNVKFLQRWQAILESDSGQTGRAIPFVVVHPLSEKLSKVLNNPWINGWKKPGQELPILVTNASNIEAHIPGRAGPHSVTVHPMPKEFVAVVWTSPLTGTIELSSRITSAHPACGNGVAWWLEHRQKDRAFMFSEGTIGVGGEAKPARKSLAVRQGDQIMLAVDARNNDHGCDLTDIDLTIKEHGASQRSWNLCRDVADTVHAGNPHADQHGQAGTWSFVYGPTRDVKQTAVIIPPRSLLDQWREALADPKRKADADKLALQVQQLLSGSQPGKDKTPDRQLYDNLVSLEGALFQGIPPVDVVKNKKQAGNYGLAVDRFKTSIDGSSIVADANSVIELRLPAALFFGRQFVVEGKLAQPLPQRVVQFQLLTAPASATLTWDGKSSVVATASGSGYQQLLKGFDEFRQFFPLYTCFPGVIANDEVVSLKMFHREDEPLLRMFLNAEQGQRLNKLWEEHQFISRQAEAENAYLPQFIGFVTQDGAPGVLEFFQGQRPNFQKRADAFHQKEIDAIPRQLDALIAFANRAFRRPVSAREEKDLRDLYQSLRSKGVSHQESFQGVLARVLVSPAFLFRVEQSPSGNSPVPVNDWELATRLSYFLWSSCPDEELRQLAAKGKLSNPAVLESQMNRMIKDQRVRSLALDFGTQWIHIRGFDEYKEKNEKMFPSFDAALRSAMYEETILFFQDLFQHDRPVTHLLDADSTYLNEVLARHYGIPGVTGAHWRMVQGVKQHGRGGLLGLASVQTKEAGASRTSPILRGNWVVETLLGEKLPKPPPNVPKLPEEEGQSDQLTIRQLVEKHTSQAECAACHQRIDPFGFALEKYDPIGRRREKELSGLKVDARSQLKDGTSFDDIDGLRSYLLTKKQDVIVRLFCRRLLGYALGRSVTLSDTALLDQMVSHVNKNQGRVSAALQTILHSPQFRMIRGSEYVQ